MSLRINLRMISTTALVATATLFTAGPSAALPQTVQASSPAAAVVRMPVIGLTAANMEKVQATLAALKGEVWVCPGCKAVKQAMGQCSGCKMDLVAEKRTLMSNVTPKVDNSMLAFSVSEGMAVKLSTAKKALSTLGVNIDENKLGIPTGTIVHVRGSAAVDPQKTQVTLKSVLEKPELFEDVMVAQTPGTIDYVLQVQAGTKAPKQVAVAAAIKGAGFELTDLTYISPASSTANRPLGGGKQIGG